MEDSLVIDDVMDESINDNECKLLNTFSKTKLRIFSGGFKKISGKEKGQRIR